MASSSPSLQNENIDKNCEELIKCFCQEEDFNDKIGFLASLTYEVLPNIALFEIETEYLAKVVPKVCEGVLESLAKITSLLQNLIDQKGNDSYVEEIHSDLKNIVNCLECLESCAVHVSQSTQNELSIKQIHSLHPGAFRIILATFSHCKDSESLYGSFFQNFSEDLSTLFKKTFQLQKVLMELIEKAQLDCNADTDEVKEMTAVCHNLLEICVVIGDVDAGLLVNTWKVLNRLVSKHKAIIKNELEIERIITHLCDCIKSKINQCIAMATVKDGRDPEQNQFTDCNEAKSFTKMIKVVRFLIGNLMHIVRDYCESLSTGLSDILTVLTSLYSSVPPSLSAPPIISTALSEIISGVLVVIEPLLRVLISNKLFANFVTRQTTVHDPLMNGFGLSRVLLDIAAILPGEPDGVFSLWMAPTNYPEEEPCFSLLQAIMEALKRCTVELNLPVYMDGVMCAAKPLRNVSFYENVVTHLSALIACTPASCFSFIENALVENLIGREFLSVIMAIDLWTFMARWESADLCSHHVHFLISLMCSLPCGSASQTHVAVLVRRLICLMAKDHQEHLLTKFPPSKAENLFTWSVLPLNILPENIQSKICRTAVPICIKQCNEQLSNQQTISNSHALCCLKSIYGLNNVQRLAPPVHHAAVIETVTSVWNKYNQKTLKLSEDLWQHLIDLTGLLLPFLQPQDYAKILGCLSDLLNQCSTINIKVALAKFLGRCGTKEIIPEFETVVFGSISGLFSTLVNDKAWLVHQMSLEAVKAFAEVTPYTHIMGDCVPEQLLPSLSDFLSNVPYKQEELSLNKALWLPELLKSQAVLKETSLQSYKISDNSLTANQDILCAAANSLEPERKRVKRDILDTNQNNLEYKEIVQTLKTQLTLLNKLRTKYEPNQSILQELQDIHLTLKKYVDQNKYKKIALYVNKYRAWASCALMMVVINNDNGDDD